MTWAQYDLKTGLIQATNSVKVSDDDLAALGRAQVEVPNDTDLIANKVDTSQTPPQIVAIVGNTV